MTTESSNQSIKVEHICTEDQSSQAQHENINPIIAQGEINRKDIKFSDHAVPKKLKPSILSRNVDEVKVQGERSRPVKVDDELIVLPGGISSWSRTEAHTEQKILYRGPISREVTLHTFCSKSCVQRQDILRMTIIQLTRQVSNLKNEIKRLKVDLSRKQLI